MRWSYSKSSSDNARNRHQDFITAIKDKIRKIEDSLNESNPIGSKESKPWVCLDEGEKDELALFLSGMPDDEGENEEMSLSLSRGHRRAATADIGYCKILVSDDHVDHSNPMHKVSSLSGFLSSMETISKWKFNVLDHHHKQTHFAISPNVRFNKGNNATLDSSDECYDKQHYGWCGTIQRQLQRSQYQMQYTGFVRVTVLIVFLLCLIGKLCYEFIYLIWMINEYYVYLNTLKLWLKTFIVMTN